MVDHVCWVQITRNYDFKDSVEKVLITKGLIHTSTEGSFSIHGNVLLVCRSDRESSMNCNNYNGSVVVI